MKLYCLLFTVFIVFHVNSFATTPPPSVGDYGAVSNGLWGTTSIWKKWDGAAFTTAASAAPPATANIFTNGFTVTLTGSSTANNMYVNGGQLNVNGSPLTLSGNLEISAGATVASDGAVSNPNYIIVKGNTITNDGSFGSATTGLALTLSPTVTTPVTINGSNKMYVGRIRAGVNDVTVLIDNDIDISYASSSTGSGIYNNGKDNFTVTINAGKTVTTAAYSYIAVGNSGSSVPGTGYNLTLNVNGTLTTGDGANINLNNGSGKACVLNVGSTGLVNVGGTIYNNSSSTVATVTVANGGKIDLVGTQYPDMSVAVCTINGTFDFDNSGYIVRRSVGTATVGSTGLIRMKDGGWSPQGPVASTVTLTPGCTVEYYGTSPITLSTNTPTVFYNLNINNIGNVSLSSTITSCDDLIFSAGKLILGDDNFTTNKVTGGTSGNYAVTDSSGTFKINAVTATNTFFPVGPSITKYNPVILNNSGVTDNFSVNVKDTAPPPGIHVVPYRDSAVNVTWHIAEDVAGGTDASVTLEWVPSQENVLFTRSNSAVVHSDGVSIDYSGFYGLAAGTDPYTQTGTGFTSFSPMGVYSKPHIITPLKLISFFATPQDKTAQLSWATENELSAGSYQLEQSIDGSTFQKIGSVPAHNNSSRNDYSFTTNLSANTVLYRIKMIDNQGGFVYSNSVVVKRKQQNAISIFPNPAVNNISIAHPKVNGTATITLYTIDGKQIQNIALEKNAVETILPINYLAQGTYLVLFKTGSGAFQSGKFTKL
jgi:hypothetical protein